MNYWINVLGTVLCGALVLFTACILVLRLFKRNKLVDKIFRNEGFYERISYVYSCFALICLLIDAFSTNLIKPGELSACGGLAQFVIVFGFTFSVVLGLVYGTKKIRSNLKDY